MRQFTKALFAAATLAVAIGGGGVVFAGVEEARQVFSVTPIGYVRKVDDRTTIVLEKKYQPGLLGMEAQDDIWVIWWFDRNDTPEQRSILQVHPRGNPANPLTGVFSTRAPVRPNLIALTRCRVVGVTDNVIEIDGIDAFADTPVLDIKRVVGSEQ